MTEISHWIIICNKIIEIGLIDQKIMTLHAINVPELVAKVPKSLVTTLKKS